MRDKEELWWCIRGSGGGCGNKGSIELKELVGTSRLF